MITNEVKSFKVGIKESGFRSIAVVPTHNRGFGQCRQQSSICNVEICTLVHFGPAN